MSDAGYLIGIATALACAGFALTPLCWRCLRARALLRAAALALTVALLLSLSALGLLTGSALHAWRNLTWEQPVAVITLREQGPSSYRLELELVDSGETLLFDVRGSLWQLDARVLRWRAAASAVGLKPRYRVERISTRQGRALNDETASHDLAPEAPSPALRWLLR